MSVRLIAVKCPECGATLEIEENRRQAFCTYCGTKVLIHNENEHIYRNIDDAGVARAKTERFVKEKQMELAERKWAAELNSKAKKTKTAAAILALGVVLMIIGFLSDTNFGSLALVGMMLMSIAGLIWVSAETQDSGDIYSDSAKLPDLAYNYERKDYRAVEAVLRSAGFTDIKCVPLNDLMAGILYKPGMVASLTINGNDNLSSGKKYPKDAKIIISYHSRG